MVIMSSVFAWAFSHKEYRHLRPEGAGHTSVFWAVLDSLNYSDFLREGWRGLQFLWSFVRRKPGTHAGKRSRRKLLAEKDFASEQPHVATPDYGLDVDAAFRGLDSSDGSPDLTELSHEGTFDPYEAHPYAISGHAHGTAERRRSMSGEFDEDAYVGQGGASYAAAAGGARRSVDHQAIEMGTMYPPAARRE
ncbi:hypothetical protein JCM8208_001606 [Rhodotorula glutinis]